MCMCMRKQQFQSKSINSIATFQFIRTHQEHIKQWANGMIYLIEPENRGHKWNTKHIRPTLTNPRKKKECSSFISHLKSSYRESACNNRARQAKRKCNKAD